MAHNIHFDEQTKKYSFFSVNEKAWHGLGQIIDQYPTSAEALKFAGLDYTVEKRKLFTVEKSGIDPAIEVPGFYATVRTDQEIVLGVVGKDYEIVQNRDAFCRNDIPESAIQADIPTNFHFSPARFFYRARKIQVCRGRFHRFSESIFSQIRDRGNISPEEFPWSRRW